MAPFGSSSLLVPNNIPNVHDEDETRMMYKTIDNTPAYHTHFVEQPLIEESPEQEESKEISIENSLDDSKRDILLMDQAFADHWPST